MKSDLKIFTSFVSPLTIEAIVKANFLPIFVLRNIANSTLIGQYSGTAIHFKELSPSAELFRSYRDSLINFDEYSKRFIIELSEINFQSVIRRLEQLASISNARAIVLMSYGSNYSDSHRKVLADIFNNSDLLTYEVKELIL